MDALAVMRLRTKSGALPSTSVLISAETCEEFEELLKLVSDALPNVPLVLQAPPSVTPADVARILDSSRPYRLQFIRGADRTGLFSKVLGLWQFWLLSIRERPQVVVTGFSLLKH